MCDYRITTDSYNAPTQKLKTVWGIVVQLLLALWIIRDKPYLLLRNRIKQNRMLHNHIRYFQSHNLTYLFFKGGLLLDKFSPVSTISNTKRPIMWKKYIDWLLNLHKLVDVIFTNMVNGPYITLIVWRSFKMPCSSITHVDMIKFSLFWLL